MLLRVYHGSMNFVKGILYGLLSFIAVEILLFVAIVITFTVGIQRPTGTVVGIDIVSFTKSSPLTWILAVLAFALGFHWKYRRLRLRQAS